MSKTHSLPYRNCSAARRCTAPAHFSHPDSRFCIDIYLPQNTQVTASRAGRVIATESRYNRSYNNYDFIERCNYIEIEHDDGQISVYAHLAWRSLKVKTGDRVRRGQVIALSGQTGYADYPHLHFGVYDADGINIPIRFNRSLPPKRDYRRFINRH